MRKILWIILSFLLLISPSGNAMNNPMDDLIDLTKRKFNQIMEPKSTVRTYRSEGNEEWITYNYPFYRKPHEPITGTITFGLKDNKVIYWELNNRAEVVEEYLSEFCSQAFIHGYPKIYGAIKSAFMKLPLDAFLTVTDRARPVLFTEYHYTGIGRFANSSNIISTEDDAPAMENGLTIVKLSVELEDVAESSQEIEGIILHELAHRVLEHAQKKSRTCQMEREANNLVKSWGYEREFLKAKEKFGDKTRTDAEKCPE